MVDDVSKWCRLKNKVTKRTMALDPSPPPPSPEIVCSPTEIESDDEAQHPTMTGSGCILRQFGEVAWLQAAKSGGAADCRLRGDMLQGWLHQGCSGCTAKVARLVVLQARIISKLL